MLEARRAGKLDQRCRSCGATSAASSRCYHCLSTDLEYREHLSWPGREGPRPVQWCEQRTVKRDTDQSHPASARMRALRASDTAVTPLAAAQSTWLVS